MPYPGKRYTEVVKRTNLAVLGGVFVWTVVSFYLGITAYATDRSLRQADTLVKQGAYDEALETLSRLSVLPGSADVARAQGKALGLKGGLRRDEVALSAAVTHLHRAARLNPIDARLQLDLAWAALRLGDSAAAERAVRAALERDPHNGYALYSLGRVQERQGLLEEAAASYRRALAARRDPQVAARARELP